MRACTAIITEIANHTKKTINADVSFLSKAEWRQELSMLLQDLDDEDGNLKRRRRGMLCVPLRDLGYTFLSLMCGL
jgi:hypothetical protein